MALREKRFKASLEEEIIPYWVKLMQEVIGKPIPMEVDWASFEDRKFQDLQYVQTTGIEYIASSLRSIARKDSFAQEAVRESIQKIVFRQVDSKGGKKITLENGVLELHCDWREASLSYFLEHEIVDIVESLL